MQEQIQAQWQSKDKEQLFVKGYLKSNIRSGYLRDSSCVGCNVVERWFMLLGHTLFHCVQKEAAEFAGALLTDMFSPVIARVDDKRYDSFNADRNTVQV